MCHSNAFNGSKMYTLNFSDEISSKEDSSPNFEVLPVAAAYHMLFILHRSPVNPGCGTFLLALCTL